ncbi:MAG: 30S ribosomal protein S3ae [Candidatus Odinarchaeia archaeon]
MSHQRKGASAKDTWKLKKWYTVLAPSYFGNAEIGETPASDPSLLVGRILETTLYDITGDISKAHVKLFFQITEVKGNTAYTIFKGHDFTRDYLRSLVRRGSSRIDGRFSIETKDGYRLIVSTIAFTNSRAKTSQEHLIRKIMEKIVLNKAKELNFSQFVHECVLGKIGSEIYNEAKKIIPLRKCDVRKSKLVKIPAVTEVEKVEEVAEASA